MNKEIIVDWDDPKSLRKYTSILQDRRKKVLRELGFDQIHFNGSKYNLGNILPAFNLMFDKFNDENDVGKSYVYLHCNPYKPLNVKNDIKHLFLASKFPNIRYEPFYVGKGTGKRYLEFNRNDSHKKIRNQITKFGKEIDSILIIENISDNRALNIESSIIDILGLKCFSKNGLLVNLDEGVEYLNRRKLYEDPMINKILISNGFK